MHKAGTQWTVKTFKAQEEAYEKYIAGEVSSDKGQVGNEEIDDATTAVPSDSELSDWEDSDDDGTNWWSGMHSKSGDKAKFAGASARVVASAKERQKTYDPSGRGRKDYTGEPKLKSAAAMMLMTLLYRCDWLGSIF